jgi:acetolactate synthase-1/2/3 large subunit
MKLTGAEIVCESLLKEGVEVIFGLPGGAVLPFYGALSKYPSCGTCWCATSRRR